MAAEPSSVVVPHVASTPAPAPSSTSIHIELPGRALVSVEGGVDPSKSGPGWQRATTLLTVLANPRGFRNDEHDRQGSRQMGSKGRRCRPGAVHRYSLSPPNFSLTFTTQMRFSYVGSKLAMKPKRALKTADRTERAQGGMRVNPAARW